MGFIHRYNKAIDSKQRNRNFVLFSFPYEYVQHLETLVYPEWYAACFMHECTNPAIWGTYGDGHSNVCLKFKTTEKGSRAMLRLHRKSGYSSTHGETSGWIDHEFFPVTYDRQPAPVRFFQTLGRIPKGTIEQYWYTDRHGNRSTIGHDMSPNEDAWRERYWREFIAGITTKLADWCHEKEDRLVLMPLVLDFSASSSRTARYDFRDLEGIIFGMRTPTEQRVQICKIIEDKCRAERRSDFKFYQAYHSPHTGSVKHDEMSLLRVTPA